MSVRRNGRTRFALAAVLVGVLLGGFLTPLTAHAAPYKPGTAQKEPPVVGTVQRLGPISVESTGKPFAPAAPVWPAASAAEVALPSAVARARGFGSAAKVDGLPVTVDTAIGDGQDVARARVESFDRAATAAAGVNGLLLRVSRADGQITEGRTRVTVDYNAFRYAYGGDWASRLRLRVLPACVLTSPAAPACQGQELDTANDMKAGTATATVDVTPRTVTDVAGKGLAELRSPEGVVSGGALVALSAGSSGGGGDYKASALSPAATWSAGGNTGDFSWSYPIRVPPSLGGPAPSISLAYSSSGVDGRMASTNNQPSWLGEGFDWQPGSIERRYNTCAEDQGSGANNTVKTGDQCWETDNASLALAGHAGELIKDGSNPNLWHLRNDDATKVERRTGASNGDNDGEWWVVTTTDGTQYWFGDSTSSTLTVPVFGNHSGEPCHQSAFKDSDCVQASRWQLSHVVDLNGNTMSYSYAEETNRYGRNNTTTDAVVYDRASYLTSIEYGTRTGGSGSAPMRVLFTVGDRCLANCGTKQAAQWPDVPWDQECTASPCKPEQNSPTYWTTKRLASIKTQVWGGSAYRDVESWTFTHAFPDPTDSITAALWLDRISHAGLVGTTATMPDITFAGVALTNRVDTNNDQFPAMNKFRIKTVTSETGGKLDVLYSQPDCVKGTRMPNQNALQDNVYRCYPVKWTPSGYTSPINDFFHKYLVTDITENDLTGTSNRVHTHYDYLGDPAWHYTDDDGFIKADYKTWSVWRGYGAVRTVKGDPGEQVITETRYFRGMHGDKLPSGTRTVVMPAIAIGNVPAVNDEDAFAGAVRETLTFGGPGGTETSATVSRPWQSAPTASRTINGHTVHSRRVSTEAEHTRTTLDGGRGTRTTTTLTTFDEYGLPIRVEDQGDDAVTDDERCTITDYVRNTSLWLMDTVSRKRSFAVNCTRAQAGGLSDDDIIDDVRTSYDQLAWNAPPTKGNVSRSESIKEYNGGDPTYITDSRSVHDANGRVVESYDVRGQKTATAFTPATGGPVTTTTETSPLGWVKTTTHDPAWGHPVTTTDVNGRRIDLAYDGLGRLISVWLAGRDKATQTPNIAYEYLIRNNGPTVVTTRRLNPAGGYITSYKLHDNLLRLVQTQELDAAGGTGAVVTDTYYDTAGRAFKTHDAYVAFGQNNQPVPPGTDLFRPTGTIPSQKLMLFDGAGREVAKIHQINAPPASPGGTEKWRTTTAYGGDRTDIVPPQGGTTTSRLTDAQGELVEVRQYHAGVAPAHNTPASGYDATTYDHDRKGQLTGVTDPGGYHWSYEFDLRGRQWRSTDPDKGTTTTTFNDFGDIVTTTDGRGIKIAYTYDSIGRKQTLRFGSTTGPKRAEWVYDTLTNGLSVKGQLVKTIRYNGADQYIKEHVGYTVDYKPTSVKYTVAAAETGLSGSYSYVYTYHQDGSPATIRLPALGDVGLETLTYEYNALGKPTALKTSLGATYVTGTDYTSFGEVGALHLRNNAGSLVDLVQTYETDTRRLAQLWTTRQTAPTAVADVRYSYDPVANVTRVADLTAGDTQCFRTDYLSRLTNAWTPADGDCVPNPGATPLGGPAKYWHSFEYDASGTRTELVEHGTTTGDRITTYDLVDGTHRLEDTSTSDTTGTKTANYTYDDSGNTKTRPTASSGTQTLTWDPEGHLETSVDSTGTTSYIYDVDGSRLIRKDPTGKTLYLPGQELRYTVAGGTKKCTRYYSYTDDTIATRTSGGVVWLVGDHHNTAQIAVNAVGQAVSIRRETPFGTLRATTGAWPAAMDKGFVGGTNDNTGLTHLGAREYDPLIGRFISVDPVIDNEDPQQMHGYAYANNAPITASDADGMWPKWLDKAANAVSNAVSTATKAVTSTVSAGAKWVYNNAGTISTVLGAAALACSVIPPLQVAAPFLGAAAAVAGAIDTYKSCASGAGLDCAMGVAGMIPGGRILGAVGKAAKNAERAMDSADDVGDAAKAARRGGTCPTGGHSFQPTMPVLMADGARKPIAEIQVGDAVAATDPRTGETGPRAVTDLHRNLDSDLTDLTVTVDPDPTVAGDESTEVIETTWNHPFWSGSRRQWVNAGQLKSGDELSGQGGHTVVVAVRNRVRAQVMYDLTVAETHTYYVLAGSAPVLVHNCDYPKFNWFERNILGKKPAPNGTIRDLDGVATPDVNSSALSRVKQRDAGSRGIRGLLNSVFRPRDGVYMQLSRRSFSMVEGNHRAATLLGLARSGRLSWDTPIYVHGLERWKRLL
jgi:RHS repeat-associated protein